GPVPARQSPRRKEAKPAHVYAPDLIGLLARGHCPGRFALGRLDTAATSLLELLLHELERRGLAGPQRKCRSSLVEEHELATDRGTAGRGRGLEERRLRGVIDQIHDQQVRRHELAADRA